MFQHLIVFGCYLILMFSIGLAAYAVARHLSDYVLGGRQLSGTVAGLSAGASDMSAWLFLGLPGAVLASGLNQAWIAIGLTIGAYLNWRFVARPLRAYTEIAQNAKTLPEFFEKRFRDDTHLLRFIAALLILVFFTLYVSSGMTAAARLVVGTFHLSYHVALVTAAVIIIAYTILGGFLAVCWTHYLQALLMLVALIVVPVVAVMHLGGWGATLQAVGAQGSGRLDLFHGMNTLGVVSLLAWGLGYFGQPHILMRFMGTRSTASISHARHVGMSWMVLVLAGAVVTGLAGSAYGGDLDSKESIYIQVVSVLFNPWVGGILLAAVMAAILSTIDSQLMVSSSALAEDLYGTFLRPRAERTEYLSIGRLTVVLVLLTAVFLAYNQHASVLSLVSYAWAGFGAAFGPVVILSLGWRRLTRNGVLAGMIVGAVTVVIWANLSGGIFDLYEIVPGFIFNLCACVAFSLAGPAPSDEIQSEFDQAHEGDELDADLLASIPE